ncbi:Uncharacterised protein [Shewanella putrefaciens]|nr:Uncharacterised protein [Shewanella putrefaciens]
MWEARAARWLLFLYLQFLIPITFLWMTTHIWPPKDIHPRTVRQQQLSIWRSVSGNEATQAIIAPHMYEHLKLISAATAFGHHALLIMDGAGSHQQTLIISRFSSYPLFTGVKSDRAGMAVATSKYVGQLLF